MANMNDLPFERGSTFYGIGATIDSNNLQGVNLEGLEKWVEDVSPPSTTVGAQLARSGRLVKIRCVRNMSAAPLLPKQVVQVNKGNPGRVTGLVQTTGDKGFPVDEFLPAGGCPQYDLCWVVVNGPAMVKTPMTNLFGGADIAAGDPLTAASSNSGTTQTGTTAAGGRIAGIQPLAATDVASTEAAVLLAARLIGSAISGRTTAETNADMLIDVGNYN